MHCFDLSQVISPEMPVYPGTEAPVFNHSCTIPADGFSEMKMTFYTHTGTHLDSPAHIFTDGMPLTSLSPEQFFGNGIVIDCSDLPLGMRIGLSEIEPYREQLSEVDFVLFYTGWSNKWGSDEYFKNFPVPDEDTADLLSGLDIKGIGIDAISVDPTDATDLIIHKKILGRDIIIIENLTNLDKLVDKKFTFVCFPLKLSVVDGSPVRAAAFIE